MNMDELRELFQDSDAGLRSDKGTSIQKNWLFERAEYREHLRENLVDDDDDDFVNDNGPSWTNDVDDDDDGDGVNDGPYRESMDEWLNEAQKEYLDDTDEYYDALVEDEFDLDNVDF